MSPGALMLVRPTRRFAIAGARTTPAPKAPSAPKTAAIIAVSSTTAERPDQRITYLTAPLRLRIGPLHSVPVQDLWQSPCRSSPRGTYAQWRPIGSLQGSDHHGIGSAAYECLVRGLGPRACCRPRRRS